MHYEGFVDTGATDFVGFYDVGNRLIGERGRFTRTASFLQWFEPDTPNLAFFTNMDHPLRPPWNTVPLSALQSRALFLQWGAQTLPPQGVKTYLLATGLVPPRPWAALPEKPAVVLDPRLLKALVPQVSEKRPPTPDVQPEEIQILFGP